MAMFDIIIPVHNAEATLERCICSLKVQSFADFRVILAENGSTDGSAALCQKVCAEDARFCLLTLPAANGPSPARNAALNMATGDYIAFVDSDDYVVPDYLAQLKRAFENSAASTVFFGCHRYTPDGVDLGDQVPAPHQSLTDLHAQDLFGYTWIKAFRREVIGQHRFCESLNLLEDEVFTCEILAEHGDFALLPLPLYCYITQNAASLAGRTHGDYYRKMDAAYRAWKPLLSPAAAQQQAQKRVRQCMYYGFERAVDGKDFFSGLAGTALFQECGLTDAFSAAVRDGRFSALKGMRRRYRLKARLRKLLKR